MKQYNRGDTYIAYSNFTDRKGTPIDPIDPQVSIFYVNDMVNYPVVEDLEMTRLEKGIYYAKYNISEDAKNGTYLTTVECLIDDILSRGSETFAVGEPGGGAGDNLIAVVGIIHYDDHLPLDRCEISATQGNKEVARTLSDPEGRWGLRLAPGEYILHINKEGFLARMIEIVVPTDQAWYNLDVIELKTKQLSIDQGEGTRKVTDTVEGQDSEPMKNVRVRAYDVDDPKTIVAQDYTDEDGRWILYLDPGRYKIDFYKYGYQIPDPLTWDID